MRVSQPLIRGALILCLALCLCCAVYLALAATPLTQAIGSGPVSHAIAFFVLPLLTALIWPSLPFWLHLGGYALFGALIEGVQEQMQMGRQGQIEDWIVDITVATLTLSVVTLIQARADRLRQHRPLDK